MTNKFSRFTALMALSLSVLFFSSFQIQAAVGDTFAVDDYLKYTVLTEEGATGTVEVKGNKNLYGLYHLNIPTVVKNNGITYRVTIIGNRAFDFRNHTNRLSSIIIPNSVTSIGDYAFEQCWNLKSITIPDSVTSIGGNAFRECSRLTNVIIGKSVSSIALGTFIQCTNLINVYYRGDIPPNSKLLYPYVPENFTIYYPKENPSWNAEVENGKWWKYNVVPYPVEDDLIYKVLTRKDTEVTLAVVDYIGASTNVVIPSSFEGGGLTCYVTEIGDRAFYKSKGLQHVEIPSSIKSIGDEAFSGCMDLKEIHIPDSVTSTGFGAFAGCRKLESAIFEGNTKLDNSVFYDCQLLSEVVFPETVDVISDYTFARCDQLQLIHIPDAVTYIGDSAFYRCRSLTEIIIPESVAEIGDGVFASCTNLTSAIIPDSVTSIGSLVFSECDQLPSVLFSTGKKILVRYSPSNTDSSYTIPDTVTYIAGSAFFRCTGLESINIPNTVTAIGDNAFYGCLRLANIEIPNNVISIGNCSFDTCDSLKNIIIPDSVISIGDNAFYHCSSLESVDIGRYVQSIEYTMFSGCTNLLNITINPDNPVYSSLDGVLFNKDRSHLIVCPAGRKGEYVLPNEVNIIEDYAFSDCSDLTSITIPGSVVFIGDYTFNFCGSLTNVYYQGDVPAIMFEYHDYSSSCIYYDTSESLISYYPLENASWNEAVSSNEWQERKVVGVAGESFWAGELQYAVLAREGSNGIVAVQGVSLKKEIMIPDSVENDGITYRVTRIGAYAFNGNTNLMSITIPDSVTSIGDYAFAECKSLTSITIPDSIISIGDCAFSECSHLTDITIGNSVTFIGSGAFSKCTSLKSITLPDSVSFIKDSTFEGCSSLVSITIPNSVTSIGDHAFWNCESLACIVIPESVTFIGRYAFLSSTYNCLTHVYFEGNVPYTAGWSFGSAVTPYYLSDTEGWNSWWEYTQPIVECNGWITQDGIIYVYNSDGTAIVSGYVGEKDSIVIQETISIDSVNYSVISIDNEAFARHVNLISITIPNSVTSIGEEAFSNCSELTSVYFEGNAPSVGKYVFSYFYPYTPATIYYREGTEGWTDPWAGRPTVLWAEAPEVIKQPQSQTVSEGESVIFTVSVDGTAPLSYQWQKNGVNISGATDSSYTISNVTVSDMGSYRVIVSNSAGSVTSAEATLTVLYLGTATICMNSDNPVIYGDSCGTLAGQKVSSDIWGVLLYNGQEVARQFFSFAAAGKPTGKLKGDIIETHLVPAGAEVTLQLAAFDQGYLDHPDTGHYYYGISKPFTYRTGDSKNILPDGSLRFSSFTIEWVDNPVVDEPVIRFELEEDIFLLKWSEGTDAVLQVSESTADGWNDITEGIQTESGSCIYKAPITAKQAFYRLKMP